ncbi:fibronectin type III domain-containing protein [Streptomyces sp. MH60]|uniref:fibronectin type III domain-containing protein n=1 Tax=Streptomyces sp. MH60 TaxID=1940758 RepID=UPI000D1A1AFC|nr:fibronectin type III domain-containing protein [Streptomyces sp. MH60]PPS89462.1 hypothetical protein BZZ08_01608 [Streptomyces sp. MH60]
MAATDVTGTYETDAAVGTKGEPGSGPVAVTQPDTSGAGLVDAQGWEPTPTPILGTRDTLAGTVNDVYPAYKPPSGPPPASNKDTTLTDSPVGNGLEELINPDLWMDGTLDTSNLGAEPVGNTAVPLKPAAPTAAAGDRYILVSWTPVPDPSDAEVLQYVVESDTGGHFYAGADKTSLRFENVTGGLGYRFRVRAGNENGTGPYSDWSAAVKPSNEDLIRPTSLAPDNAVNPIYRQDGTLVPGSYGAPTAPGKPTVAAEGTAGTAKVTWTAPSSGQPSGGYDVKASSGQKVHVGPAVLTANVPGLTVGANVTFTVTAIGQLQNATSPASNAYTVV